MISEEERKLALGCLDMAAQEGAQKCRISLSKSTTDLVDTLNGEIDKVSHCLDRSLSINLFVDGKFGSFSTNRLGEEQLRSFIHEAVEMTRLLAVDPCRDLPDPERCCRNATEGTELGLYDPSYDEVTADRRREIALGAVVDMNQKHEGFKVISEEGEYSDSEFDAITADSNGLFCRHMETSFEYASEITVEAPDGEKYSGYWWEAAPFRKDLDIRETGRKAIERAARQIGAEPAEGGKYTMVVDSEVASKLLSPVLNALGGYSIQQNNSFMADTLGKKVFPEGLTILDDCLRKGESGSRLFDSEGVATSCSPIIENGVVKEYFLNTYIAAKMGMQPTIEDSTRAHLMPWPEKGLDQAEILRRCGEGMLVTGFNGGNCNSATGDFSYGIEGFRFKDGKVAEPVSGMLITGNFIDLWNNLIYAGEDARPELSKIIPTIAFAKVDFNG